MDDQHVKLINCYEQLYRQGGMVRCVCVSLTRIDHRPDSHQAGTMSLVGTLSAIFLKRTINYKFDIWEENS